jgi:single-strand DNA-binding protein
MNLDKVILAGMVADIRTSASQMGKMYADISLDVQRQGKDSQVETTRIAIKAFGKVAELCQQYVRQGEYILVEGELVTESGTAKSTGRPYSILKVYARSIQKAGAPAYQQQWQQMQPQQGQPQGWNTANPYAQQPPPPYNAPVQAQVNFQQPAQPPAAQPAPQTGSAEPPNPQDLPF